MWQISAVVREIDGNTVLGLMKPAQSARDRIKVALRLASRVVYPPVIYRMNRPR
jgi:hypothetical protein